MTDRIMRTTAEPATEKEAVKKKVSHGAQSAVLTDEQLAAFKAYNEHVERDGVFSDGLRSF